MTEVMWGAADPGGVQGLLHCFTVAAAGGAGRVAHFRHRDATGKLVHAAGLLQDAVVHLVCGAEDHALRLCQTPTIRRTPREVCSDGRVSSG